MTMLTRYHTPGEMLPLRHAMDRLFEDSLVAPGMFPLAEAVSPRIDIHETDDDLVVSAALPGIKPDDVEVTLTGQTVTLRGEIKRDETVRDEQYIVRERRTGRFQRQIALPVRVEGDQAEASFEDGVLTLHIPKAAEVKPRQIAIKAESNGNAS